MQVGLLNQPNPLSGRPLPIQFAIPTRVTETQIQGWLAEVIRIVRDYVTNFESREVFVGKGGVRYTPRGIPSVQAKTDTPASSDATKLLTISSEAKSMLVSMLSMFWTEIFLSIIYLHHRAYELEELITLTTDLSEHIISFEEQRASHRTSVTKIRESGQTMRCGEQIIRLETRLSKRVDKWITAVELYTERHPEAKFRMANPLDSILRLRGSTQFDLVQKERAVIHSCLSNLVETLGRRGPIVLETAEDVVLLKQEDFEYPFDGSMFEIAVMRSRAGHGHQRFERLGKRFAEQSSVDPTMQLYSTIREVIGTDLRACIVPSPSIADSCGEEMSLRLRNHIDFQNEFFESVSGVVADYIIDMGMLFFNHAVASTNMVSSTTINLQAMKLIYLGMASRDAMTLSPRQIQLLTDVMTAKLV